MNELRDTCLTISSDGQVGKAMERGCATTHVFVNLLLC